MRRPAVASLRRAHPGNAMLLAGSIGLLLCAPGCAVLAGKADYADYRAVRLAHDDASRLLAMQRYTQRHPNGHWFASVQAERERRDIATFEASKATAPGLQHYLQAFPDGVFAEQARSRLSAIALIEQRERDEAARAQQLMAARKQREAELSRTWVTRFLGYWTKTLAELQAWGAAIPEVAKHNPAFSRAFGAEPRPRCTRDECVKYYTSHYAVPVPGGTRVERSFSLLLRLRMREGKLVRAELLLPDHGFSRWFELEQRNAVVEGDPESRRRAVAWAEARALPLLQALGGELAPGPQGYVLAAIEPPAIGPNGELTDTTAEDPAAPRNRIGGLDRAAAAAPRAPELAELIKPKPDEPAADMVFAPLTVDRSGHAAGQAELATPNSAASEAGTGSAGEGAGSGGVMVMAPLAVPKTVGGAPAAGAATPSTAAQPSLAPTAVPADAEASPDRDPASARAYTLGALQLVVFAAASDAPGESAYDGIVIEQAALRPAPAPRAARPAHH